MGTFAFPSLHKCGQDKTKCVVNECHVHVKGSNTLSREEMWVSTVTLAMVALEILEVGMNTVNKAAMSRGLSHYILVTYSNILAIFLLSAASLIFYRKKNVPPGLTWSVTGRIFLMGILSCCGQEFTNIGLRYSSPTLASAMIDLTPAFTFLLAISSRMEGLNLRVKSSMAKALGTVALITGGLVVTLYKGLPIISNSSSDVHQNLLHLFLKSNWALGGFFLAGHSFILSVLYVMQTWTIRDYPAELIVSLINCIFVAATSGLVSLYAEKDPQAWKIGPNIELIAVGYSAAFAVTLRTVIHTWACHRRGPVYTSMFKPIGMVIAVFVGVSFLGDNLYLGSVIGAATIVVGFYSVIWGKRQEEMIAKNSESFSSSDLSSHKVALLKNCALDA